ncbi:MAG: glucose 1-dehydrogenase, partial [Candidatus Acidiferrales bacterium]
GQPGHLRRERGARACEARRGIVPSPRQFCGARDLAHGLAYKMNFAGKVAVVTGGGSGIGRACSLELLARGATVAVVDWNAEAGAKVVRESGGDAQRIQFFAADLSKRAEVERLVTRILGEFGGIDALASNAGIQRYGNATDTTEEEWDEVLGVNLKSAFLISKETIPHMIRRGGGAIALTASVQSLGAQRNSLAYMVSKHALLGLMRSLALDYAKDKIRVNALCPGAIDTPMLRWAASLDDNPAGVIEAAHKIHPLGRMGEAEEMAHVIAFLLSDEASFVTGSVMVADGGLMLPLGGMAFQEAGTGAKKA